MYLYLALKTLSLAVLWGKLLEKGNSVGRIWAHPRVLIAVLTLGTSLCWRSEATGVWVSKREQNSAPMWLHNNCPQVGVQPPLLHVKEASSQRLHHVICICAKIQITWCSKREWNLGWDLGVAVTTMLRWTPICAALEGPPHSAEHQLPDLLWRAWTFPPPPAAAQLSCL